VTAHTEALARLVEQGYTPDQARHIVAGLVDPTPETCATCGGRGWTADPKLPLTRNEPCRDCNGTGVLTP
jgi:DnaJ-class molecular chaperone